ncbi:MAG: hypothetical protein IKQ88_03620 [Lachnospiraceae bacterium]|nr:hypothetical protein [Lachnospiraceae bacterium]
MAKLYNWLDRRKNETPEAYDRRINHLAAFHAGFCFFARENYTPEIAGFSVYVIWNGEFNSKLFIKLPDGGFMLHCLPADAEELSECDEGIPVYVKIRSYHGRLRAEHLAVAFGQDLYDLYYNGCELRFPAHLMFAGKRFISEHSDDGEVPYAASGDKAAGSYRKAFRSGGSYYPASSFSGGSYINFLFGKLSTGGSFTKSSYLRGSFLSGINIYGSARGLKELWRQFLKMSGSFSGSFSGSYGSYTAGSYFHGSYFKGSYAGGSYRGAAGGGGNSSSFTGRDRDENINSLMKNGIRPSGSLLSFIPDGRFKPSYRCIAEMGYGLDLI